MGALILPGRFNQQPQQAVQVDPAIRADFAWLASVPKSSIAGPSISSSTAGQLATVRGLAINSGYAVVASAAIPSLYATTWTEFGSVLLDGANQLTPLSVRNEGQAVVFIPASALIDLVMWGVADVNISGALPVGVVHYVARRVGSTHTIWLNGRLYGSASSASAPTASAGTLPAVGAQAGNGGSIGGTPLVATTGVLAVVRTPLALSDAQCAALSANPWQMFAAPRRLWAVASSGTTFSYTASGGFTLSGTATTVRSATKTATGGLQLSGAAATARGAVRSASGGLQLSGSAAQARSKAFTASGGISISGAASVLKGVARLASGGLTISGAASAIATTATQSRIVVAAGGFALSGTAAVIRICTRATSGGISFAGAAATSFQRAGAVIGGWINMARRRRRE